MEPDQTVFQTMESPSAGSPPDQAAIYRRYSQLRAAASGATLAGRLVLSIGFRVAGAELALATMIAQGCFLGLEPDAASLKQAVRSGACDFMVNTLDEALRVLKNEIRKKMPLSVGLLGEPPAILKEMVERGVQPDWIGGPAQDPAIAPLIARGAARLTDAPISAPPGDSLVRLHTVSPADMRRLEMLAAALVADDPVRRDWMQHAPAYFSRQLPPSRVVELSQQQIAALRDQMNAAAQEKPFEAAISIATPDGATHL